MKERRARGWESRRENSFGRSDSDSPPRESIVGVPRQEVVSFFSFFSASFPSLNIFFFLVFVLQVLSLFLVRDVGFGLV